MSGMIVSVSVACMAQKKNISIGYEFFVKTKDSYLLRIVSENKKIVGIISIR